MASGSRAQLALVVGLFILFLAGAAYMFVGPVEVPRGRVASSEDLARGAALIRRQYSSASTRVGRVSLLPAGLCAMRGSAEFIDGGAVRQADCIISIGRADGLSAECH